MNDHSLEDRKAQVGDDGAETASLAEMRQAIEALYFAYRDFTRDADEELAQYGFGRAHHRVIYFVGRHPGITVSDLLALLRITKQSLAPVLAQLVEDGFVLQRADVGDRRRRRLYLSPEALNLERVLTEKQARRLRAAFATSGSGSAEGFVRVLQAMVDRDHRADEDR
ncbi:MAG: MarR family transcriptional regulator [Rhodospirillales bacterium]